MKNELKKWEGPAVEVVSFDSDDIITTSIGSPVSIDWAGDLNESWELKSNVKHELNEIGSEVE